ncbi:hypothetical protein PNOK_0789400 [Pyrrhoderma noxium]|uniref:Uncharacterized protein n=1 Tax=Pyrrhoderma noxium TaxID=2282107 RepID=A0A286U9T5_9AGAM|nr:hypothetical protein PNOK_0789400 [Pyrrhoderma noxium]
MKFFLAVFLASLTACSLAVPLQEEEINLKAREPDVAVDISLSIPTQTVSITSVDVTDTIVGVSSTTTTLGATLTVREPLLDPSDYSSIESRLQEKVSSYKSSFSEKLSSFFAQATETSSTPSEIPTTTI